MEDERPDLADELIQQFCAVAGAEPHVAENYLSAHNWDLETAVDFYFLHPPGGGDDGPAAAFGADGGGGGPHLPPLAGGGADDAEFAAALAASMGQQQQHFQPAAGPPPAPPREFIEIPDDDDVEEQGGDGEDGALESLARRRAAAVEARRAADRLREDELMDLAEDDGAYGAWRRGGSGSGGGSGGGTVPGAIGDAGDTLDLPEGINVEEARMLEAAMLGVPYTGRVPDFGAAAAPADPAALAQRMLRREQDDAFEESLAADRAKQASLEEARRAADAAAAAKAAAEAAAVKAAEDEARALEVLLGEKTARLPAEPPAGEAGTLQVVVRLPDGARAARRFRRTDPLRAAFDFVDVRCGQAAPATESAAGSSGGGAAAAGASGGGGSARTSNVGGGGMLKPGSYRLVTQFPRRVFEEGQGGSLEAAGLTTDTAMFVEPL